MIGAIGAKSGPKSSGPPPAAAALLTTGAWGSRSPENAIVIGGGGGTVVVVGDVVARPVDVGAEDVAWSAPVVAASTALGFVSVQADPASARTTTRAAPTVAPRRTR
jgi:hypothetical protein